MFGYVKINRPELSCEGYGQYRGMYCSLCRALGRRYGPAARLLLNYDMTFYAILALSREGGEFRPGRCAVNPLKKCQYICEENALNLTADVSMLMAYYQWRDKLEDSVFFRRLLWALPGIFFFWAGRRAKKKAPEADRIIHRAVAAQRLVEHSAALSLDYYAHPSAHALGELCALLDERLRPLGYLLGRWVYLADAADDYDDDLRHGHFNAFQASGSDPKMSLNATAAELSRKLEGLEFARFSTLIEHILTLGIAGAQP